MKMYTKIKRPDNSREQFEEGMIVTLQEKIDGSNVTIYNDGGELKFFSRTRRLNKDEGLSGFVGYAKEKFNLNNLPLDHAIHCEWLGQAKIGYNSQAKRNEIARVYAFDVSTDIIIEDDEIVERTFLGQEDVKTIAGYCEIPMVPIIDEITFTNYKDIKEKYSDEQPSLLNKEFNREGVVVKSLDGELRIKIVADKFREMDNSKKFKIKDTYDFFMKYVTGPRLDKFVSYIEENDVEIKPENYGKIFKEMPYLVNDLMEEEGEKIMDELKKIMRKEIAGKLRTHLDNYNIEND